MLDVTWCEILALLVVFKPCLTHVSFTSDPAEAPVLRQPQLPPHGGQSDWGGVQRDVHRRAHTHRTVQVLRVRPRAHGEDRCREAQLQVQSHHCLNLSAFVPPDRTFTLHRQVRPKSLQIGNQSTFSRFFLLPLLQTPFFLWIWHGCSVCWNIQE